MTPLASQAALQTVLTSELPIAAQVLSLFADGIKVVEGLAILYGVLQLWRNRTERREAEAKAAALARKAANYQAWQVVNGAYGKGGSGGRVDALQDLVANHVSLSGVKLDGAWLEKLAIPGAEMRQASLRDTKLIGADLSRAVLDQADLGGAQLEGANLGGASLRGANVAGAHFGTADLSGADLHGLRGWQEVRSMSYVNVRGVRNAPAGFLEWAMANGAVDGELVLSETMTHGFSTQWRAV